MTRWGSEKCLRAAKPRRQPSHPAWPGTIDRYFGLTAADTTLPTEFRAGLATFLTMAYIMFVNPSF